METIQTMELLNINMPPFARTAWYNDEIKSKYSLKLQKAAAAYHWMELETVSVGMRACTTRHIRPDSFECETTRLADKGLLFLPLRKVGSYQGFAHSHPPVVKGRPWSWYGVVARSLVDARTFAKASDRNDHRVIGRLLGYPNCCQDFFSDVWGKGFIDPVWQEAWNTEDAALYPSETKLQISSMQLWTGYRYIGLRAVPHLPCSFSCSESLSMVDSWLDLAKKENISGVYDLLALLNTPCRWSCFKGVAIITSPLFKVSTNSMPCWPEYIVVKGG